MDGEVMLPQSPIPKAMCGKARLPKPIPKAMDGEAKLPQPNAMDGEARLPRSQPDRPAHGESGVWGIMGER